MTKSGDVIVHADDFGINPRQSECILSCAREGLLNSTSVMVGSPHFSECAKLLDARPQGMRIGLHENLVEGPCCARPEDVPLLVDGRGYFNRSFVDLFRMSLGAGHDELRRQAGIEIAAQLERFVGRFPEQGEHLRIDGHQHFQLIPAVFEATLDAVRDGGYRLEYLRIPAEPTRPFLRPNVFFTIKPINWAKHLVLNWCWQRDRPLMERLGRYEDLSALFCGVLFSGHMDQGRVRKVFPAYAREAGRRGMSVEFLFHPGGERDAAQCLNPDMQGFVAFYQSPGRDVEREALMGLALEGNSPETWRLSWRGDARARGRSSRR